MNEMREAFERRFPMSSTDFLSAELARNLAFFSEGWHACQESKKPPSAGIESLGWSRRVEMALKRCRIISVSHLLSKTERDLLMMYGIGKCCLEEIRKSLADNGLKLAEKA